MDITTSYNGTDISFTITSSQILELVKSNHLFSPNLFKDCIELGIYIYSMSLPSRNGCAVAEVINSHLQGLSDNLETLVEPLKLGSSSAKLGRVGEVLGNQQLQARFPNYEIKDVSQIDKSGDAILVTEFGDVMIEHKNYSSVVSTEQINKVKRDLLAQDMKLCLFISYRSKISGKKPFDYDIYDDTIIVYIHSTGYDGVFMELGIYFLKYLASLENLTSNNHVVDIVSQMTVQKFMDIYEKMIQINKRISRTINSVSEVQTSLLSQLDSVKKQLYETKSEMNLLMDQAKEQCSTVHITNKNTYTELHSHIETIDCRNKDKILINHLLESINELNIHGYIESNKIYFHKNNYQIGYLLILKSRVDILFNDYSDDIINLNKKYERLNEKLQIILTLSDDVTKWNIIFTRFKNELFHKN